MKIARVLFCAALLFTQSLFTDGFVTGTPIKTVAGFVPIESLKVGDVVASFDLKNNSLSESTVTATACVVAAVVFEVEFAGKKFEFLSNQLPPGLMNLSESNFQLLNNIFNK
jgi:hypothetical protein